MSEPAFVRLVEVFDAPRERVFAAWTEPERLKRWWGPGAFRTTEAEVDLRPGGRYALTLEPGAMHLAGEFREVVPPERLVYTWRWVSGVVLLALLACGGAWWDQRSDWQRYVENGLHGSGLPFEGVVPPSATVLWDDSLIEPWLLMQRQQFFASEQGAGLLFSRPTAMEFAVHENAIRPMLVQRQVCKTVAVFTGTGDVNCYPTPEILREICQQEPRHPDYMVFRALPDSDGTGAVAIWNYRPGDPVHSRSYRLYDCARMH